MRISFRTRLTMTAAACLFVAACSSDNNTPSTGTPSTPSCTIAAAAGTTSYTAAGGTGTVTVSTASGCAWTATSGSSFITITAGGTGSGNGTVSYTVAANTGAARTGTVTVGGTAITISQAAAAAAPTGTLAAPTANSPTAGASVPNGNPTLVVNNAAATGNVGTVTYRFEVSDQPTFPNDPVRTFTVDGIAQGSGSTTSWTVARLLGNDVLWYWHARATNGTVTTDYSATETFRTPTSCTYAISPTTLNINSTSATATINVTTNGGCGWTASTSSSFITILSGASGSGSGSVFISIPNNNGPQRTGTVTIGGQTLTVTQAGAAVNASFVFQDSGTSGAAPVTECLIRSLSTPAITSTCVLQSTSVPVATGSIASYTWQVQYGYGAGTHGPFTISGNFPTFTIQEMCGQTGATDDGAVVQVQAILTVTDSAGNSATVSSGSGSQPPLTLRVFNCGK